MKDKIRKIRKSRIFNLFEILLFIAVCIGAGALWAFVNHESDPTEQAVVYFRAFVQRDYDKMYDCVKIEDGYYVNKEMYKATMKKVRENMQIDTYDIKEPEKVDGKKQVVIECTNSDTKEKQDFIVRFTEKRKGMQIIPDYYVNIDNMLVGNFSVKMSKDNNLELNGEKITDQTAEISMDKKDSKIYRIKGILNGQYKVSATNNYAAIFQNVEVNKNDTAIDLTGNNYTANDKYTELLKKSGENVIEQFYSAVRKRNPSSKKLIACFDKDKKLVEKVKNYVKESQEIVYWTDKKNIDKYKVIEMKMSKLDNSIKYDSAKKRFVVDYIYSYNYVSSTDTALYNSYVYKLSGKCSSTMKLTYTLKDDNIVLTNIKITNKNKKDKN